MEQVTFLPDVQVNPLPAEQKTSVDSQQERSAVSVDVSPEAEWIAHLTEIIETDSLRRSRLTAWMTGIGGGLGLILFSLYSFFQNEQSIEMYLQIAFVLLGTIIAASLAGLMITTSSPGRWANWAIDKMTDCYAPAHLEPLLKAYQSKSPECREAVVIALRRMLPEHKCPEGVTQKNYLQALEILKANTLQESSL